MRYLSLINLGLIRLILARSPIQILRLRPPRFAQSINSPVPRNGKNPGRDRSLGRIIKMRLLPQRRHHILRAVFCQSRRGAGFHQKPLHPRRKMSKQLRKSRPVSVITHRQQQPNPIRLACVLVQPPAPVNDSHCMPNIRPHSRASLFDRARSSIKHHAGLTPHLRKRITRRCIFLAISLEEVSFGDLTADARRIPKDIAKENLPHAL